jgi:cysteinyl-tRNA synthetase
MVIRVQDTLTGRRNELQPAQAKPVRIYVCGITPYAESHIGHARPSVFWDVVRRHLRYRGFGVLLVQNFTDIDDKIIAKAQATGEDALSISRFHSEEYLRLMDLLGVERADVYPRVSDHLDDIIALIAGLVSRGAAYEVEGNVWFEVASFAEYGKLSHRSLDDMKAGARVEVEATKRNPADFALWKRAKPNEPSWPSPWGPGRPGWHIECSAMALRYLGPGFDLHGGGSDLIFPHHENEIAQSEAFSGEVFCRNWLHNEMLNLRGEKMSKSLGNVVTLREVLERAPGGAVRLLLLGAHYRKALDFDFELLDENRRAWRRLNDTVDRLRQAVDRGCPESGGGLRGYAATARRKAEEFLDDDFNTAGALAALFDLSRQANAALDAAADGSCPAGAREALEVMEEMGRGVLGLVEPRGMGEAVGRELAVGETEKLLALLVEVRNRLRTERNFALSDHIRESLAVMGFEIKDGAKGTVARKRD